MADRPMRQLFTAVTDNMAQLATDERHLDTVVGYISFISSFSPTTHVD